MRSFITRFGYVHLDAKSVLSHFRTDTSTHTSGSAERTSGEREASVHLLSQEAAEDV